MEDYANRCGIWLQEQVNRAEAADPQLKQFKAKISELGREIDALNASVVDADAERLHQLLRKHEDAIIALIQYIAQRTRSSGSR